jgi:DNA-binding MarR family transcriptional regulator
VANEPTAGTPEWIEVWRDLLRAHVALTAILEKELEEERQLPLGWYDVLVNLNAAGGRLRMQELARSVLLSKSGLTRLVDRMESAGLVTRQACAVDRRGTEAVLTDAGHQALRDAAPIHIRGVEEHFASHLDDEELTVMGRALAKLLDANEPCAPITPGAARPPDGAVRQHP